VTSRESQAPLVEGVAIVGMAGRFPGAQSVAEFWRNQLNGIEAISHFRVEDLEVPNAAELARDPNYVLARSVLDDVDLFDPEFFGMLPREAELMDPQQRLFLECCWQALEDAGYDPYTYSGSVGVYGGSSPGTYFLSRLCTNPGFIANFTSGYQVGNYPEMMGNSLDFLCTRVAYKLNLRGPAFTMVSGCSTSLMAVTQACQSLLTYQTDMSLAGGASITFPQKRGCYYQDGGMVSPDGHCRTFDADAQGTVFGGGVAVVLLKRLEDAVRDGDQIYAVIRGFAANNDGSAKVGYTAPSVEGQARVIALAQEAAGVPPETIGYVEAHGTGTPLGDPIELAALTQAFRAKTPARGFCAVGTAKTNVGHLDIAAGVTGLIHATHIVRHGVFPPTLHYQKPNPKFDLDSSPFYVNPKLSSWNPEKSPRRAGVSAFGIGGTNAHVVIEEAPARASEQSKRPAQLLVISARSEAALERATDNLVEHFRANPSLNLADAAWTLQAGRRVFPCRRTAVAGDSTEAIAVLSKRDRQRVQTRLRAKDNPAVYFLFPGQGSQHANMAREIYETEPVFRQAVDRCAEILRPYLGADLRTLLYPPAGASEEASKRVTDTIIAQPAIFTVEYALAQLWMSWGIRPQGMLGHSIGEFVAACVAGVLSLEDALTLVATRGRMMQDVPAGGMLSVRLPESEVRSRLNGKLSLAAVNSPSLCVVAGPYEALEHFEQELGREGIACRRLVTSHAFHSAMMDGVIQPFTNHVAKMRLNPPRIPFISGVTGTWITGEDATDPAYWARHCRQAVQFSAGVSELRKNPNGILLEVGPGNVLNTLARQHAGSASDPVIVSSLSDGYSGQGDAASLMNALGSVWLSGVQPNWVAVHTGEHRQRISLPTYPFERKRYWLEAPATVPGAAAIAPTPQETVPAATISLPMTEEKAPVNLTMQPTQPTVAANPPSRITKLRSMLAEIFEELSGVDVAHADSSASFLELGFDSLFLTQVSQSLQSKFHLKITFRQLLGDQGTLDSLAEYVDSKLPPEMFSEPSEPPVVAGSVPAPATGATSVSAHSAQPVEMATAPASDNGGSSMSESPVERLMREQLQAMNQLFAKQLEALRGTSPAAAASAPAAVAPAATTAPTAPGKSAPAAPLAEASKKEPVSTSASAEKDTKELKGYTPFKPLPKGPSGELTPRQKEHIRALVERYTKRTAGSKQKTQEYRQALADPRVVAGFRSEWKELVYPIITVRSEGSHLWDVDGNEYVDILNGFGPIMLGHRPDFVEKAVAKQLHEGFEIGPQTLLAGEVAKMICEFTGNERVTFCNTGSEAVTAAMRLARTVTGRNKVVFFAGDYHGMFDEVLVKGFKKGGVPQAVPVAPGIPREKAANVVVLEYGAPDSLEWIRQNAKDLAAVMVEPVQTRHPDLQPVEFLRELRKITEESDTCLIFDEVVTGFRVHPGGCQALFGIRADLATYGKVLAGGMPIGVLAGKAKYMDALDGGMWQFGDDSYPEVGVTFFAGTFVRHPLALAAVKAVLEYFKEQGPALQAGLTERTGALVRRLNKILESNQVPTHIENFASFFYFTFPNDFRFASLFYFHLRAKGIHLLEGFPCFMTTAHSDADMDRIVRAFEETVAEMQEGGVLPEPAAKESTPQSIEQPALVAELVAASSAAPVTESQLEVWLSDQLGKEASCSYNESFTLHMRGDVNESALREALKQVIRRHDGLRATFDPEGQTQRFAPKLELEIPAVDLSALSAAQRKTRIAQLVEEDAYTPFKLDQGPLVRAQLVKLEPRYQVLIFTSHHIVCDGWSTNVLLDEFAKLYNALNQGVACDLPKAVSFANYARSQADFFNSPEGAENEKYWLEEFREPAPLLDLPTDRPRPAVRGFEGATYRKIIGAETYNNIKRLGARQKSTLFVTLLAGLQMLLSRLTGQDDIVVGIPSAGQSLVEDGVLVGHCVNFLPLRGRTKGDPTAAAYLAQIRQTLFAAYDHQNYTYGRLVRKLTITRDPSRLPLTEVQFNLERVGDDLHFDGFEAEVDPNPKSFVNFDIFLNVIETKDGLILDCDYSTGLYDEATIARWLSHYEALLEGMVADVNQPISSLPMLTAAERGRMLVDWNDTQADYARNACVHQLFEAQAKTSPNAVAVAFEGKELTYAELDRRANQLAHYLAKLGVKPGVMVGVFVERSLEMIVSLLGVMKAGGAYVPMDPTYPVERISFVLTDANAPVLLTQQKLAQNLPMSATRLVCLDSQWGEIARENGGAPSSTVTSEDLAYVIYTSGSTGKPKGVEIPHRAVVNLLSSMRKKPGLGSQDTLCAVTTLSFDIAGLELFLPLCVGAKLVIASREVAADGTQLLNQLISTGATAMQATPVTWKMLLEAGWDGNPRLKALCGGEAFPRELANELVKRAASVWNMYGPTETTIWSATAEVKAGDGPVRIGPPIDNTQFYVLDPQGQLAPIGLPGELHIGGDGLARGYFRRPELTAEKFIRNPFQNEPNARIYKTGDLVRRMTDGTMEFLGRLDHQVKLRGFRIELGEIETAMVRYPGVREAVVIVREDIPGDKRLVAYVTSDQQGLTVTAVREFLTGKLPNYMLPSAVVRLDAMPLTPNGKIDRKGLPAPDVAPTRRKEFVPPRTNQERMLADIWSEVLHLEQVGIQDNLFELGADSLHIFQIAARANKAGLKIAPAQFLKYRTISSLLAQLETEKSNGTKPAMPAIVPVARDKFRIRQLTR
jgi:amino acid adenylation domain-containing protein